MAKVKLVYEFDLYEEKTELAILSNAMNMYSAISDLDAQMRDVYKHDDLADDHTIALIERWRDLLRESNVVEL